MIDHYFKRAFILAELREGLLGGYVDKLACWLVANDFTPDPARRHTRHAAPERREGALARTELERRVLSPTAIERRTGALADWRSVFSHPRPGTEDPRAGSVGADSSTIPGQRVQHPGVFQVYRPENLAEPSTMQVATRVTA